MKLITEGMLREMAVKSKEIVLEPGSRLTPSAKDLATMMGLTIIQEYDRYITRENRHFTEKNTEQALVSCRPKSELKESEIEDMVRKVLERAVKSSCTSHHAKHIKGNSVEIPPFDSGQPGVKMGLANLITSKDANLAAGFMTFHKSELSWKMTYDEVNYVIEGDYRLKVDNQIFNAKPGDILYIPKGAQVIFSSPGLAKVFYVTYPANWDELSEQ